MKRITEIQNEVAQLEKLAAQRYLYSLAKRGLWLNFIFSIPVIVIYFILSFFYPILNEFKVYIGITISFINIFLLIPYQNKRINEAAIIQEQFDTDVLQIKWNLFLIKKSIDTAFIIKIKNKYLKKKKDFTAFNNWYNINDEDIPIEFARFICQKENVWWEKEVRSKYMRLMLIIPVSVIFVLLILNLIFDSNLKLFINEIFYLSPTILFSFEQYSKNKFSIDTLDELNEKIKFNIDEAIHSNLNKEVLDTNSRLLQDRIYFHRLENALILDAFYQYCKKGNEIISKETSQNFIDQFRQYHNKDVNDNL
jgi:hypothetical protein